MIFLYTTYYNEKNSSRKAELDICLKENVNNKLIDKIYLLDESNSVFDSSKINALRIDHRPSFNDFFDIINTISNQDDINIIANSDIFFNESLKYINSVKRLEIKCLALGRWDFVNNSRLIFNQNDFSQDAWIFKGKLRKINGNIPVGTMGCDNKIAYEIWRAGYKLINPSLSVIAIHYHSSQIRYYDNRNPFPPPYKYVLPESLENKCRSLFKNHNKSDYHALLKKKISESILLQAGCQNINQSIEEGK